MKTIKIQNSNRIYRFIWKIFYLFFFKYTPNIFFSWRVFILKLFGAKIGKNVRIYPKVKIWSPKNLIIGDFSCIANQVDVYNVDIVKIGNKTVISQKSYLIGASKNYKSGNRELLTGKIEIGDNVWIAAAVTIGPNVNIGNESVILTGAYIFSDIDERKKVKLKTNYTISDL